jgi:hypothetical protein
MLTLAKSPELTSLDGEAVEVEAQSGRWVVRGRGTVRWSTLGPTAVPWRSHALLKARAGVGLVISHR